MSGSARPRRPACSSAIVKAAPRLNATARGAAASRRIAAAGAIRFTGRPEWSLSLKDRAEVLTWLAAGEKGADALAERELTGQTFGELASQWWQGVQNGSIGKRKGRSGSAYSANTLKGYERSLHRVLLLEFGARPASEITAVEWQTWIDHLSRRGLSRSRIANLVSVASAVYGWASRPTRRLVEANPLRGVELPPNDDKPRMRVAPLEEAEQLLAALDSDHAVPYALAFYAGLRREEIHRLRWGDVELDGYRLIVRNSKSEAGTDRRPPIAEPLRVILLAAYMRAGRPAADAPVSSVSVVSGKLARARPPPGRRPASRASRCTSAGTPTRRFSWRPATR